MRKVVMVLAFTLLFAAMVDKPVIAESTNKDVIVDMTTGKGNANDKQQFSDGVSSGVSTNGGIFGGYDEEKPVIKGAKNRTVSIGGKVDFKKGIKVLDEWDGNITKKLKVNSKNVNLKKAGKYKVTYSATDKEGNKATKTITITVKESVTDNTPSYKAEPKQTTPIVWEDGGEPMKKGEQQIISETVPSGKSTGGYLN